MNHCMQCPHRKKKVVSELAYFCLLEVAEFYNQTESFASISIPKF